MTETILVLALTSDGGKWDPGTIIGTKKLGKKFIGGLSMAGFVLVRVKSDKYSLAEIQAMKHRKRINLSEVLSAAEKQNRETQKINALKFKSDYARLNPIGTSLGITVIVRVNEIIHKPDLTKIWDFDKFNLMDIDPKYLPKEPDIIEKPTIEEINSYGR